MTELSGLLIYLHVCYFVQFLQVTSSQFGFSSENCMTIVFRFSLYPTWFTYKYVPHRLHFYYLLRVKFNAFFVTDLTVCIVVPVSKHVLFQNFLPPIHVLPSINVYSEMVSAAHSLLPSTCTGVLISP